MTRLAFHCKDSAITVSLNITPAAVQPPVPRAVGEVRLSTKLRDRRTELDTLRQAGSLKCLFPRLDAACVGLDAVLVNTAGGVTGGDQFSLDAHASAGTQLTLTTQACERAYKAQPDQAGHVRTTLRVGPAARLNWLPQETILFQGSAMDRSLKAELSSDASLLMVEPLVFGRAGMGEVLSNAQFADRIEIRRDGQPLYLDALQLNGDVSAHMARAEIGGGAGAMASAVFVAADAAAHLPHIRDMLPETAGASLLHEDVLVLRVLAHDSFALRQTLVPVLARLRGGPLPRCWML